MDQIECKMCAFSVSPSTPPSQDHDARLVNIHGDGSAVARRVLPRTQSWSNGRCLKWRMARCGSVALHLVRAVWPRAVWYLIPQGGHKTKQTCAQAATAWPEDAAVTAHSGGPYFLFTYLHGCLSDATQYISKPVSYTTAKYILGII